LSLEDEYAKILSSFPCYKHGPALWKFSVVAYSA